jgi:hypothetical protein
VVKKNTEISTIAGYQAVYELYHAFLTGLILSVVMRRSRTDAAELVFHTFRKQHLEKFLPGLKKLGLEDLPDAVACAQYHYLSNFLGGVKVEYMPESDRKSWVRYLPPRWIFDGTAICGMPSEVSRAMMLGWHAHNGVSLGNPRLGFVCTKQTTDGQPGLEGYYIEYDYDLKPEERLRFEPGEDGPDFDPTAAPKADGVDWPEERLQKVSRNYAMEYIRTILPEMIKLFGPGDGGAIGKITGKLIGMQFYDQTAAILGINGDTAAHFADYLAALGAAQDEKIEVVDDHEWVTVRQKGWRLMRGLEPLSPAVFDTWNGLWEGAISVHNRHLLLEVGNRMDVGDDCYEWRIRKKS